MISTEAQEKSDNRTNTIQLHRMGKHCFVKLWFPLSTPMCGVRGIHDCEINTYLIVGSSFKKFKEGGYNLSGRAHA